ncbi:MAG TPA: 4-hydroxy-3-methylbut-2-enyl diphosphate reductase [Bacteroidales bacterium]|nr:4-hydroxy-3-methylbut-2-enyl diphosphate reductase [Bacteroidales bacterium]HSA44169.1 4-hydroxy-3-methylbut-2-enyl diphosphate reductase [Bacteroidales bacterium]
MEKKEKLQLKPVILDGSGFCSGVKAAIRKAEALLDKGDVVYCVGEIVHNEAEIRRLEARGMRTVSADDIARLEDQHILFRAHGEPSSTYRLAEARRHRLTDATCHIVLRLQAAIQQAWKEGEKICIFGKAGHPEVIALQDRCGNEAILLTRPEDADLIPEGTGISLFSQTTRSRDEFLQLAENLKKRGIAVKIHDTVCRQVVKREKDLAVFARRVDVMLLISGRDSSNGKLLFEVCRSNNPRSRHIASEVEIEPAWFGSGETVGIAGATSTPECLLRQVKDHLESL